MRGLFSLDFVGKHICSDVSQQYRISTETALDNLHTVIVSKRNLCNVYHYNMGGKMGMMNIDTLHFQDIDPDLF